MLVKDGETGVNGNGRRIRQLTAANLLESTAKIRPFAIASSDPYLAEEETRSFDLQGTQLC